MKQSRAMSLVEAVTNVTVGYGLAVITRCWCFRSSVCERASGTIF